MMVSPTESQTNTGSVPNKTSPVSSDHEGLIFHQLSDPNENTRYEIRPLNVQIFIFKKFNRGETRYYQRQIHYYPVVITP